MSNNNSPFSLKRHLGTDALVELVEFARTLDAKGGSSMDELLITEIAKLDRRIDGLTTQITNIDVQIEEARQALRERIDEIRTEALAAQRDRQFEYMKQLFAEIDYLVEDTKASVAKVFRPEQNRLRTERDRLQTEKRELLELSK